SLKEFDSRRLAYGLGPNSKSIRDDPNLGSRHLVDDLRRDSRGSRFKLDRI
ncbi:unnamed protein product, partial [Dovyalis caffra]